MPGSTCFKRCSSCKEPIPLSDGHSQCIKCLGETHIPQRCAHCSKLSSRARKDRELKLKLILLQKSLGSAPDFGADSGSAPHHSPPASKRHKKTAERGHLLSSSKETLRHKTSSGRSGRSAISLPVLPRLSTFDELGFSSTTRNLPAAVAAAQSSSAKASGFQLPASLMVPSGTAMNAVPTYQDLPESRQAEIDNTAPALTVPVLWQRH